jgi:tellurite resistance protein TehA-like permease
MASVSTRLTRPAANGTRPGLLSAASADLHPAYFAMVMATGIVSIAAELGGLPSVALALFWINVCAYFALWILTLVRIVRHRGRFLSDLFDHGRCVGFFTVVAATCVLGNQFVIVVPRPQFAVWLWSFGIALWAVTTYTVLTILTVKPEKPPLADGINGGWLVAVVAAQSVAALGGLLAPEFGEARDAAVFFALIMWLGGGMLYIWIISLIFYRYTFFTLDPRQLAPPYWINMGAMAISTLAGTIFAENAADSPLLARLQPFIIGLTLLFWATATWWIPLLLALGVWRHVARHVSISYEVVYWSAVFPLGMYTACTHRLARVIELPFLEPIPRIALVVALTAWGATMLGLLQRQVAWLRKFRSATPSRH